MKILWWIIAIIGGFLFLNIFYLVFSSGGGKGEAAAGVAIGLILLFIGTKKINQLTGSASKSKKK